MEKDIAVSGRAPADTVAAWRAGMEAGDAQALGVLLAEDITVISPLTAQFRFHGRRQAHDMLVAAHEVLSDLHCHTELGEGRSWALFFHGRAGRETIEEAQLLRLNDAGDVAELTLFGRPLPGLTRVMADIGPRLLRRQGRPGLARVIGLATGPLAAVTRFGDRRVVPLGDPSRGKS